MRLYVTLEHRKYRVLLQMATSLGIPLKFNGAQPNHFGASRATSTPLSAGEFIGDTRQGGSCNVSQLTFVPHCNGTHTESSAHIVHDAAPPHRELPDSLQFCVLVSVTPEAGYVGEECYTPAIQPGDKIISRAMLQPLLEGVTDWTEATALVIRTLPNPEEKRYIEYDEFHEAPFFTHDAMHYLVETGIQHLLVDFPSIDKMHDQGKLSNHRIFWHINNGHHQLTNVAAQQKTITELIYVPESLSDGVYLLNLQVPAFESDAAPSRPVLYPLMEK